MFNTYVFFLWGISFKYIFERKRMVRGYKAFILPEYGNWLSTLFRPKVKYYPGETYETKGPLKLCENGFHFCEDPMDCFWFYNMDSCVVIYVIEALGDVIKDTDKCCTNKIQIIEPFTGVFLYKTRGIFTFTDGQLNSIDDMPSDITPISAIWRTKNMINRRLGPAEITNDGFKHYYAGMLRIRTYQQRNPPTLKPKPLDWWYKHNALFNQN